MDQKSELGPDEPIPKKRHKDEEQLPAVVLWNDELLLAMQLSIRSRMASRAIYRLNDLETKFLYPWCEYTLTDMKILTEQAKKLLLAQTSVEEIREWLRGADKLKKQQALVLPDSCHDWQSAKDASETVLSYMALLERALWQPILAQMGEVAIDIPLDVPGKVELQKRFMSSLADLNKALDAMPVSRLAEIMGVSPVAMKVRLATELGDYCNAVDILEQHWMLTSPVPADVTYYGRLQQLAQTVARQEDKKELQAWLEESGADPTQKAQSALPARATPSMRYNQRCAAVFEPHPVELPFLQPHRIISYWDLKEEAEVVIHKNPFPASGTDLLGGLGNALLGRFRFLVSEAKSAGIDEQELVHTLKSGSRIHELVQYGAMVRYMLALLFQGSWAAKFDLAMTSFQQWSLLPQAEAIRNSLLRCTLDQIPAATQKQWARICEDCRMKWRLFCPHSVQGLIWLADLVALGLTLFSPPEVVSEPKHKKHKGEEQKKK